MQRVHSKGENERKETLALQCVINFIIIQHN